MEPSPPHVDTTPAVPVLPPERAKQLIALSHDYHAVFDTEEGQRVLKHLRLNAHQDGETLNLKTPNALTMAFREGQRQLYLVIERMLALDVDKIKTQMESRDKSTGGSWA